MDYITTSDLRAKTTGHVKFIDADTERVLGQTMVDLTKTQPLGDTTSLTRLAWWLRSPQEFDLVIDVDATDIPLNAGLAFLDHGKIHARVVPGGHGSDGPVPRDPLELTAEIVEQLDGRPVDIDKLGVRIVGNVGMRALDPLADRFGTTALRMSLTLPAPITHEGEVLPRGQPIVRELDPPVAGSHDQFGQDTSTLTAWLVDATDGRRFSLSSGLTTPVQASPQPIPSAYELVFTTRHLFVPRKVAIELQLIQSGGEQATLGRVLPGGQQ